MCGHGEQRQHKDTLKRWISKTQQNRKFLQIKSIKIKAFVLFHKPPPHKQTPPGCIFNIIYFLNITLLLSNFTCTKLTHLSMFHIFSAHIFPLVHVSPCFYSLLKPWGSNPENTDFLYCLLADYSVLNWAKMKRRMKNFTGKWSEAVPAQERNDFFFLQTTQWSPIHSSLFQKNRTK